jgi:hypothetical protein
MATKNENRSKWVLRDGEMVFVAQEGERVTFQVEGQNPFVLEMGAGAALAYDAMGDEVDRGPVLTALGDLEQATRQMRAYKAEALRLIVEAYDLGASYDAIAKVAPLARPGVMRTIARAKRQQEKELGLVDTDADEDVA